MSAKYFCDACGNEMNHESTPHNGMNGCRLAVKVKSANRTTELGVEVITTKDGISNAGDFCKYCILDALAKLDDRPKL
jgi:hypothetical protein